MRWTWVDLANFFYQIFVIFSWVLIKCCLAGEKSFALWGSDKPCLMKVPLFTLPLLDSCYLTLLSFHITERQQLKIIRRLAFIIPVFWRWWFDWPGASVIVSSSGVPWSVLKWVKITGVLFKLHNYLVNFCKYSSSGGCVSLGKGTSHLFRCFESKLPSAFSFCGKAFCLSQWLYILLYKLEYWILAS